ncbi:hypothetical protein [Paracoccus binzhouensis]|uniref:hypothetical protein n=1 Tax=Paracoccus binzhouensis TaxID=2796149 RepID=UPI0018EF0E50|nr:hypothetical protein [Paracoccus binzhouensis]
MSGVCFALAFKLSLLGIFLAYSLGGICFTTIAVLGLLFARSSRRSAALAMQRNHRGYFRQD